MVFYLFSYSCLGRQTLEDAILSGMCLSNMETAKFEFEDQKPKNSGAVTCHD